MNKRFWVFATALAMTGAAVAAEMRFDRMSITKAPRVRITEGRWNMQGGVELTLFPQNPEARPLNIKANEIVFAWDTATQSGPQKVDLKGDVQVDGDIGTVASQTAVLDIPGDRLEFTERVTVDSEQFSGVTATQLIYNLANGDIEMSNMTVDRVPIEDMAPAREAPDPMLLTVADIRDWTGIMSAIKAEVAAEAPSPGKRLISLLPEEARAQFHALAPDAQLTDGMKRDFVGQLNRVLQMRQFYDAAAWDNVSLPEPVPALVSAQPESGAELIKLNRGLFEAAYPQFVERKVIQ